MSRLKDLRRELERVYEAIEALDVDLAAARLGAEEHGRQRAEREREAGRLFVALRRAQRERDEREGAPRDRGRRHAGAPLAADRESEGRGRAPRAATMGPGRGWLRNPLAIAPAAVLLVAIGVGGGMALWRWIKGPPSAELPPTASSPAPAAVSSVTSAIELQALRQIAAREDAPTASLLQLAHVALDQGQLPEARRVYERVLAREPKNVEAITHIGAVLFQEGRVDEALRKVEEALGIDPRYIHALWDRTQYLFHGRRDYAAAATAAEAFLGVVPEGPDAEQVRKLLAEARRQAGQVPPGPKGP